MRTQRLGTGRSPAAVLRGLHARTRQRGIAPPAALTGHWFGSAAVLVPSVAVLPCAPTAAFTQAPSADGGAAVGGGWIGYRGYPDGAGTVPPAAGGWTDCVLRLDHAGDWWFESLSGAACPAELERIVVKGGGPAGDSTAGWELSWTAPDGARHRHAVRACLDAIAAGEVYQACVCTRFTGQLDGEPVQLFTSGITADNPARAAYLAGSWGAVVSFSPELFLARHGRTVHSSPIKGTLPIGLDPELLRASTKDVAENVMIVDLVRNDLGRVCVPGSITVPELLSTVAAPAVWHLVSTVRGTLRADVSNAGLLAATFPPASVTGTPKQRARELLVGWENTGRGVYCGAVGMASPVAGLELNVAIRTVELGPSGSATLGVGGGITIDSDPEAEWQECLAKGTAITRLHGRAASTAS